MSAGTEIGEELRYDACAILEIFTKIRGSVAVTAYFRLETKNVKRSEGHSSVAAAAYNTAEKLYDERTGITYDYRNKQAVYDKEILAPANAPAWVFDRNRLWNECEKVEDTSTRPKDARPARQLILCFPAFLSHEEKIRIARSFLQQECVAKGMIVDVAYHDFEGEKATNPHAHVLLTTRLLDGERFGKKERTWNAKQQLQEWREKWAEHQNRYLEQHGYAERVDHRSYQQQGIDRVPGLHEGRAINGIRQKIASGKRTETTPVIDNNEKIKELNRLRQELAQLQWEETQERQKTAEQDNRQPPLTESQETAKRDFAAITKEVLQGVTAKQPDTVVTEKTADTQQHEGQTPDSARQPPPEHRQRSGSRPPNEPSDRTYRAVRRQLEAMGGNGWFEIGIGNDQGKDGEPYFHERTWHKDQILLVDPQTGNAPIIRYLKGENARGSHIYVRPAPHHNGDSQGLILIDDLDPVMVEDLQDKGLQPSVVVETSHKNCQAWVRISDRLTKEEATHLAKLLARETGGDPASASYQHYGRLAGFTNRKDKHLDVYSGKYPWVLLHQAVAQPASQAQHYLELARLVVTEEQARRQEALKNQEALIQSKGSSEELRKASKTFQTLSTSVERRYGIRDASSRDWVVLKRMAKRGYSLEALEYALWSSPDLAERKKGHTEDYVRRTIDKIALDADVLETLQRRQQSPPSRSTSEQPQQDERLLIAQWQQYQDRERGSRALSPPQRTMKQPGEDSKPKPSPGIGNKIRLNQYQTEHVPIHPLGAMDAEAVRYVVGRTLQSQEAQRQADKALWALSQDTQAWKDQCKAEYLKELGRILSVRKVEALTPHTDAELAVKLRLAGFSHNRIAKTLASESPFLKALADEQSRHAYLSKGIAPVVQHPNTYRKIAEFWQTRTQQAMQLPPEQQQAFLKEYRFDRLNIATHSESQLTISIRQPHQERKPEAERER